MNNSRKLIFAVLMGFILLTINGCATDMDMARDHEFEGDYGIALVYYAKAFCNDDITEEEWNSELVRMEANLTDEEFRTAKSEAHRLCSEIMETAKSNGEIYVALFYARVSLTIPY